MDQKTTIEKVRQYKLLLQDHLQVDTVYLFGSFAKDTTREDSDIDVAVVVSSDGSLDYFVVNPLLWKLRRQIDERIEPILINKNEDKPGFLTENSDGMTMSLRFSAGNSCHHLALNLNSSHFRS